MLVGIDASRAFVRRPTGTEVYSLRVIQALAAVDGGRHDFRLYLREQPPASRLGPRAEIRVLTIPRLWTHIALSAETTLHPPDVLFVPAHVLPVLCGAPAVVTVHDLGYEHFPESHPWSQRLYLKLSTRWSAATAALVVADSKATARDLTAMYGVSPSKIVVAYPGVDPSIGPVLDADRLSAVRMRYDLGREPYLLYLGTLQPRKNLVRLVRAFAQARAALADPVTLVVAGKPGWMLDELSSEIRRLGIEGLVKLPGYIEEDDKAALLSGATAFVFPSLYEGFGLPVLEAQACGCPVVTSETSSLPEVAGEGALLVDPMAESAIAAALVRIMRSVDLRLDLMNRGQRNVQRFDWLDCARVVLQALERAASQDLETRAAD